MKKIILVILVTSLANSEDLDKRIVNGIAKNVGDTFTSAFSSIGKSMDNYNAKQKKKREKKKWEKERISAKKDLFAQMNKDKRGDKKVKKQKNNMIIFE